MNLFVDTNIYLDFYHFSKDDLEELKKLVDVISKGEINLVVTNQVIDEIKRNRDYKIADAYKQFIDSKLEFRIPEMCKNYPEYKIIKSGLKSLHDAKDKLIESLKEDIKSHNLQADILIEQLLEKATKIDTNKYLAAAKSRFELGTPPGKDGSYGDAINWTGLLVGLKGKDDLFFISDDKDFKSPFSSNEMSSYLIEEWRTNQHSNIYFYPRLSDFFRNNHQDIQLKIEEEKNKWVEELESSPNFAYTHHVVARLATFSNFTDNQITRLGQIAISNSQVNSILNDEDIKDFYQRILKNKYDLLDSDTVDLITKKWAEKEL